MTAARRAALIWDALNAIEAISGFVAGRSFAEYAADALLRAAVERQFIIVGEALAALRRLDPETAGRIPMLPDAVGFRNVLVHSYGLVTHERVWGTTEAPLAELRATLVALLDPADRPS